jgi:POT family proton-dependent oligopeptide transporter
VIAAPSTSLGVFTLGIITIGLGTGGFKSNVSILIAEQYTDPAHIKTLPSGERVIVDPVTTASRLYLYFYMAINFGALFGQITMSFASNYVGFWLGWTLPTIIFSFCPLVMWFFRKQYVKTPPTESVVAKAAKAFSLCLKGRGSWNPIQFYRNCKADSFWQNAKPSVLLARGETLPSYMNWDDQWIDELRRGVKSCAVFTFMPLFWLCYNQNTGNLTSQAATMDRGQVPNDIISNLNPITLIIFIPICDKFLYPFLARKGIDFTPIKRITCGFFLGAAAMIWAAVTQHYIYKTGACGKYVNTCEEIAYAPINVWVQTGSYVLIGFSEIFASVTCLEYAYTNSPSNLRSVVMSLFLFSSAIASALGQAFVALSDDPLLVWNYVVMAILATVGGIIFWFTFRSLDAEQNKLTRLEKSTFVGKTKDFEEM